MDIKWQSQLAQDRFVVDALGRKHGGIFVDIGAGHPTDISNTVVLERHFGWTGILCDIEHEIPLRQQRGSNIVVGDAMTADWDDLFSRVARDGWIDYLSLDLEPPDLTRDLLMRLPLEKYRARIATVEHDLYREGHHRMVEIATRMYSLGYEFIGTAGAIIDGQRIDIEDWWIHRDSGIEMERLK